MASKLSIVLPFKNKIMNSLFMLVVIRGQKLIGKKELGIY